MTRGGIRRFSVEAAAAAVTAIRGIVTNRMRAFLSTIGIAIGGTVATAGVFIHLAGHALTKSLGFYAAIPLIDADPAKLPPMAA